MPSSLWCSLLWVPFPSLCIKHIQNVSLNSIFNGWKMHKFPFIAVVRDDGTIITFDICIENFFFFFYFVQETSSRFSFIFFSFVKKNHSKTSFPWNFYYIESDNAIWFLFMELTNRKIWKLDFWIVIRYWMQCRGIFTTFWFTVKCEYFVPTVVCSY